MTLNLIQQILLGIIQGITEWLPISSSGVLTLINSNFFHITDISELIHIALFFHFGTFLAALIYFRREVLSLTKSLFNYKYSDDKTKKTLKFLIISTLISGIIGILILKFLTSFETEMQLTGKTITLSVVLLLFVSGMIQLRAREHGHKKERQIKNSDSVVLGFAQGVSTLPGISRSGITVSTLLLKNFDDTTAIKLSFLMSLPIVLFGNLILNFSDFTQVVTLPSIYGLLMSFLFGILAIHLLMKLTKKINFGYFLLIVSILMGLSLFI
ncbi:MAG: undecaprenyl-diphosphate phosphatase [Candidatus Pacearchaeota archaeon]|jgi:undecaprenyl-diphosphatase